MDASLVQTAAGPAIELGTKADPVRVHVRVIRQGATHPYHPMDFERLQESPSALANFAIAG
jgi:hypothetical protein